nr:retrovirus-related Pol polyprotein from transposon TNT 1-94 [Tanacetum cinerariifolium]
MLCYLVGIEPYYLKCINDGPFQLKIAKGDSKPESQWTPDERRVVVQDQCLESIIMSCLPDDIMESDEEEVFEDEDVTQVKVLMALADDELIVGKSLARNGEWVDITIRKIQNIKLTKLNHALQEQLNKEKKINEKWLTSSKKVSQCISEQISHQKKKVLGGELLTESLSRININENAFIPASMRILYYMICKREDHRTLDHEMYIASLNRSENYKAQPYQYASISKQILKAKASCTHYGFNNHRPDDYINYPKCEICGSYDHLTSGHNRVIHIRGGVLAESSIRVKCNTCKSTVHSTFDHNEFDHFKRETHQRAHLVAGQWMLKDMTGVKSYLHKYVKQPGPKVVFGDNSSCITEGYDSINREENHVPEVIVPNEHDVPLTKDIEDPPELINMEGTHEQNIQDDQMITQPTNVPSGSNTEVSRPITEPLVPDVTYFAPVARMEAIRIFLVFATYINFKVYQIDAKSAFLNGKLKEEVYVKQPHGFESSEFPDYACKLDKILYGIKQAPRTWYETLSTFLIQNEFSRGRIDNTLFIYKSKGDVLLVQVNVDDIIFGSTSYKLCFDLKGYSDSDYDGCNMDIKSTSAEAEYVAAIGCCASILWMKSQLSEYDIHYKMVPIFCENTSAIAISNNLVLHSRTKHIDIRYHFIRDHILKRDIELHFILTEYQLPDIFTKPLDEATFIRLKAKLGMLNIDSSVFLIKDV